MAVCQSKILLQGTEEFAPSTQNDCVLKIVYCTFVVCFGHLRVSLISQHIDSIDRSLVASQLLNPLHELLGFNWIGPLQRACERINCFGVLRVERDSAPPSHDRLRFPLFLFQDMTELIKCCCLIGTQSDEAFEQVSLYLRVAFITFQCGPVIQSFSIFRSNVERLPKLNSRFFTLSQIA